MPKVYWSAICARSCPAPEHPRVGTLPFPGSWGWDTILQDTGTLLWAVPSEPLRGSVSQLIYVYDVQAILHTIHSHKLCYGR